MALTPSRGYEYPRPRDGFKPTCRAARPRGRSVDNEIIHLRAVHWWTDLRAGGSYI